MTTTTLDGHIETTPGVVGGRPRIAGRRITVEHVAIWHVFLGRSADEIAADYDLALADIYAALTYYHDHRDAVDARIREGDAIAEAYRAAMPSKLHEKLSGPALGE